MAIRGTKPKPDDQKVTRHELSVGWIEVPDVPFEPREEHELGPHLEPRKRWAPATLRWYDAISRMPHCVLWRDEQWQFARTTALVYERWIRGDNARAGEIRQREAKMGTTFDARRDLRIRYVNPNAGQFDDSPEEDAPAPVSDFAAAQRRRLLDAP